MSTAAVSTTSSIATSIESAQRHADGGARFHVAAHPDHPDWARAEQEEATGGVSAELRIFLDAQLEAGDILVDASPGFGFVALSATTAPGGLPSVFALRQADPMHEALSDALQSAARDAGGWIEPFTRDELTSGVLTERLTDRLAADGRIFVHAAADSVRVVLQGLAPFVMLGRVVACVVPACNDADTSAISEATEFLHGLGFGVHELREQEGEPQLFTVPSLVAGVCAIALAGTVEANDVAAPAAIVPASDTRIPVIARNDLNPAFAFIAPYCRTGYGMVGAHLLREFLLMDSPVAYFPLGHVDRTLVRNEHVERALARQGYFDDHAPSVRLSQQFDLALHVGRGPRVGFPIFELDRFQPYELHHLERQDRLIVTCEWARTVLLENGLWRAPIDIVPLGVDRTVFHEDVRPARAPGEDTVFASVGKLETRKGQHALLRAFEAAFTPKDRVRLVLVCHNPFVSEKEFEESVSPFRRSPMAARITVVTKPLPTQHDLATVMATADCGVFPVRAEGWNLEALEMLSMGKQVIATACTGHTAFLTNDNARLVSVDALEESVPGDTKGRWAAWGASQHEQLVEQLRAVHVARQSNSLGVNQAGIETAKDFSWTASAKALIQSVAAA